MLQCEGDAHKLHSWRDTTELPVSVQPTTQSCFLEERQSLHAMPTVITGRFFVAAGGLAMVGAMLLLGCILPRQFPSEPFATFLLLQLTFLFAFTGFVIYMHNLIQNKEHPRHSKINKSLTGCGNLHNLSRGVIAACPSLLCFLPLLILLIAFPPILYISSSRSYFWETSHITTLSQQNWYSFIQQKSIEQTGAIGMQIDLDKEQEWHRFNDTLVLGEYATWGQISRGKIKWATGLVVAPIIFSPPSPSRSDLNASSWWYPLRQEVSAWALWEGSLEATSGHVLWGNIWPSPRGIREGYVWTLQPDVYRKNRERAGIVILSLHFTHPQLLQHPQHPQHPQLNACHASNCYDLALIDLAASQNGLRKANQVICITAGSIEAQQSSAASTYSIAKVVAVICLVGIALLYGLLATVLAKMHLPQDYNPASHTH